MDGKLKRKIRAAEYENKKPSYEVLAKAAKELLEYTLELEKELKFFHNTVKWFRNNVYMIEYFDSPEDKSVLHITFGDWASYPPNLDLAVSSWIGFIHNHQQVEGIIKEEY